MYTNDCISCLHQGLYSLCTPGTVFAVFTRECIRCVHQGLYTLFTPGTVYAVYTRDFIRHLHQGLHTLFTPFTPKTVSNVYTRDLYTLHHGLYTMFTPESIHFLHLGLYGGNTIYKRDSVQFPQGTLFIVYIRDQKRFTPYKPGTVDKH